MSSQRNVGLQLSMFQAMKLIVFCAAAFACVAPIVRLWAIGGPVGGGGTVFIFSAIAVPSVWASLSFVLVRRGTWRDRLILSLLLFSVSAALVTAIGMLSWIARRMDWSSPAMIRDLLLVAAVAITLAASVTFLVSRLARVFRSRS